MKKPTCTAGSNSDKKEYVKKTAQQTPRSVKNEKEEVFRPQSRGFPPAHDAACGGGSCAAAAHGAADPPVQLRRDRKASETAGIQPTTACHDNAGMYYSSNLFFFPSPSQMVGLQAFPDQQNLLPNTEHQLHKPVVFKILCTKYTCYDIAIFFMGVLTLNNVSV